MEKRKEFDIDIPSVPSGEDVESAGKGLLFGALAVALGFGMVFIARSQIAGFFQQRKFDDASEKALQIGTEENFADRLYSAIDGIGTDEDEIFDVFNAIPSKRSYRKVYSAYKVLTDGNDLNEDLKGDLSGSDLRKVQQILNSKPE